MRRLIGLQAASYLTEEALAEPLISQVALVISGGQESRAAIALRSAQDGINVMMTDQQGEQAMTVAAGRKDAKVLNKGRLLKVASLFASSRSKRVSPVHKHDGGCPFRRRAA